MTQLSAHRNPNWNVYVNTVGPLPPASGEPYFFRPHKFTSKKCTGVIFFNRRQNCIQMWITELCQLSSAQQPDIVTGVTDEEHCPHTSNFTSYSKPSLIR
jgi:hypothetical protein